LMRVLEVLLGIIVRNEVIRYEFYNGGKLCRILM